IHSKMKEKLKNEKIDFADAIVECKRRNIIDDELKGWLETQRARRNDIVHNNERYDYKSKTFIIDCKDGRATSQHYCYKDFPKLRKQLLSTKQKFFEQIENK